jgi:DUF4097 and DUF4098 domain-containing protein YvlB
MGCSVLVNPEIQGPLDINNPSGEVRLEDIEGKVSIRIETSGAISIKSSRITLKKE